MYLHTTPITYIIGSIEEPHFLENTFNKSFLIPTSFKAHKSSHSFKEPWYFFQILPGISNSTRPCMVYQEDTEKAMETLPFNTPIKELITITNKQEWLLYTRYVSYGQS